VSYSLSVS